MNTYRYSHYQTIIAQHICAMGWSVESFGSDIRPLNDVRVLKKPV